MPLFLLAAVALAIYWIGKKSTSCGVTLAILLGVGVIVFFLLTSQLTITGTLTGH